METKQTTEPEQTVNPEKFKDNVPNDKSGRDTTTSKRKNLGGIGALLIGIAAILTVIITTIFNIYDPDENKSEWTSDKIIELIRAVKSEESPQLKKSVQKVEKNHKASVVDKAIFEAYRLQLAGEIEDALEKWRSVANVVEGTNNDLAAGAWYAVGFLHMKEIIGERKFSVFSIDRVSFPLKPYYQLDSQDLDAAEKAILAYNEATRLKDDFAEAYNNLGSIELVLGQYESDQGNMELALERYNSAFAFYDKAIHLKNDFAEAHFNLGLAKVCLNRHEEAIKDFDKAIRLNSSFVLAHLNLGFARTRLKQYEAAIKDFDKVIELNPNDAGAHLIRGLAKGSLNQHEEAIKDFDEANSLNPDDFYPYLLRGLVRIQLKQYEKASDDFDEVIERNRNYAKAYLNRGFARIQLKQYEAAIKDFDKVIELNPNDADAYYNKGIVRIQLKQYEKASDDFTDAIERNLSHFKAYYNRGMMKKILGDVEKARQDLQTALKLVEQSGNEAFKDIIEEEIQKLNSMK